MITKVIFVIVNREGNRTPQIFLRMLVYLVRYDSGVYVVYLVMYGAGQVSLEYLVHSWYPFQRESVEPTTPETITRPYNILLYLFFITLEPGVE